MLDKTPVLMQKMMVALQQRMVPLMEQMQKDIRQELGTKQGGPTTKPAGQN